MDFLSDQLFDGRKIRVLSIIDNFSRVGQAAKRQRPPDQNPPPVQAGQHAVTPGTEIIRLLRAGDPTWGRFVPLTVAEMITERLRDRFDL